MHPSSVKVCALDESHFETGCLSAVLALGPFLVLLDAAAPLFECLLVLCSELDPAVTVDLLSLARETLALHNRVVNVAVDARILLSDLLVEFIALLFLLLLPCQLGLTLLLKALLLLGLLLCLLLGFLFLLFFGFLSILLGLLLLFLSLNLLLQLGNSCLL